MFGIAHVCYVIRLQRPNQINFEETRRVAEDWCSSVWNPTKLNAFSQTRVSKTSMIGMPCTDSWKQWNCTLLVPQSETQKGTMAWSQINILLTLLSWWYAAPLLLPSERSCGKVMFSQASVILSTGGGDVWQTPPPGRHPPPRQTPPPGQTTPPPARRPLQRTVRILMECILVAETFWLLLPFE